MRDVLLLIDYKGEYWVRHKFSRVVTDLALLGERFAERGMRLIPRSFSEVDLRQRAYRGAIVLYQSAQDSGLSYKSYIEDVVLGLELAGAVCLPSYQLLRAHHNKVFMEMLRDLSPLSEVKNLSARSFGSYEEFERVADDLVYPAVFKLAAGDTSKHVELLDDAAAARRIVRRKTRTLSMPEALENVARRVRREPFRPHSLHRSKFVVQTFVPGLDHDWKSVVMGDKWFVTVRPTRAGDFRASGSAGARRHPEQLPPGLLAFMEKVFASFAAPFASIDVLHDGSTFYLTEIQFLRFGTRPVVENPHHFVRSAAGGVELVRGRCEWERELAQAVQTHLHRQGL